MNALIAHGSIDASIRALPKWYQVLALLAVIGVFGFGDNFVVKEVVRKMHFGFGTELMWPTQYRVKLESMTLHERTGFAVYSIVLGAILFLSFKLRALTARSRADRGATYIPKRPRLTQFIIISSFVEASLAMRAQMEKLVTSQQAGGTSFTAMFAGSDDLNVHFCMQVDIIVALMWWWVTDVGVPTALAAFYRISMDAPKKRTVALRWVLVTFATFRVGWTLVLYGLDGSLSAEKASLILWTLMVVAIVNWSYGPEKRRGIQVGLDRSTVISHTVNHFGRCCLIPWIAVIGVLTVMVGVHVIELIVLWFTVVLMALWIPAAFDSFSTNFAVSCGLAMVAALNYFAETRWATSLLGGALLTGTFLAASAIYNTVAFALRSRHLALGVLAIPLAAVGVANTSALEALEAYFEVDVELRSTMIVSAANALVEASHSRLEMMVPLELAAILACAAINSRMKRNEGPAVSRYSPKGSRVIVSFRALFQKSAQTAVTLSLTGIAIAMARLVAVLLPSWVPVIGSVIASVVAFCITLGIVMDMRGPMVFNAMLMLGFSKSEAALVTDVKIAVDESDGEGDGSTTEATASTP